MTGWLPPLPLLGEGGWGGEGQTCCATFAVLRLYLNNRAFFCFASSEQ